MAGCVGSPHAAVSSLTLLVKPVLMRGAALDNTARKLAEEAAHDLSGRLIHAQEEEQTRLARELHDDLSQSLALLSVELEMFGQSPPAERGQISARMQEFSAQVKRLSSEVHRLSHELHPAKLEQLGLVAAMRGFCKEFAMAHEMAIQFADRSVPRAVPEDTALCLYRITQEALHNVVRHSGGTAASVELTMEAASFVSPSPMTASALTRRRYGQWLARSGQHGRARAFRAWAAFHRLASGQGHEDRRPRAHRRSRRGLLRGHKKTVARMNRRPRVLLADDHTMLLDAFRRLLEPRCEIVGTACDGRAAPRTRCQNSARRDRSRHLDAAAQRHGRLRPTSPKNAGREACLPHGE